MAGDAVAMLAFAIAGQSNHAGIINMDVLAIALPFWVCAFLRPPWHVFFLSTAHCQARMSRMHWMLFCKFWSIHENPLAIDRRGSIS